MKYKKFRIDIYDWDVCYLEAEKKDNPEKIISILHKLLKHLNIELENDVKINIKSNYVGGARCYTNNLKRKAVIFLYKSIDKSLRLGDAAHEVSHLADEIKKKHALKGTESKAYIVGFIMKKLYKFLK